MNKKSNIEEVLFPQYLERIKKDFPGINNEEAREKADKLINDEAPSIIKNISGRNMNKTNPYTDEFATTKQTNDDQVVTQNQDVRNDYGGWISMMSRRKERKGIINALFDVGLTNTDTSFAPSGIRDYFNGADTPFSGAEPTNIDPYTNVQNKKRNWPNNVENWKDVLKRYHRNKDNALEVEDQNIHETKGDKNE